MDYLKLSLSSIKQTKLNGGILELNGNLCKFLIEALVETEKFLHERINELSEPLEVGDKRRAVLLQLYFVVKQAETLVRKCCESQSPAWPERALTLLGIKEDILDIVLHLRWWESILDIAIASTVSAPSEISERIFLKSANQKFEETLDILSSTSNELQEAADLDKVCLVQLVDELQRSYAGEPGSREHYAYLLSVQIHSLLTDEEVGWISELNGYKYVGTIGSGGFGVVLQVEWCGYDCALKIFNNIRHDRNEAESLKKCRHPHIVQCFRHWEPVLGNNANTTVQSHILMERMPSDLATHMSVMKERKASSSGSSEVLKGRPEHTPILPFSNPVAVDVMLQVSKAMWYMHSKEIIHRDLKPGNVLMKPVSVNEVPELFELGFLQVKLADFGLARGDMMSSNDAKLTRNAGSTLYRAPELSVEQYLSGHNYPHKADLWSFGIMCAEILSGLRPFQSDGVKLSELNLSITSGLRPHLPEDCPDYLKVCIESCWKHDPKERPRFSEIWKMLRFAKLRSLGIIEQNYDLFTFEDSSHHFVEPIVSPPSTGMPQPRPQPSVQPRPQSPTEAFARQPGIPQPRPQLSVQPRPQSPTEAFARQPGMPLRQPSVQPRSPTVTPQPSVPRSSSRKKKVGFWTSILLKLGLITRTRPPDPSAHLESSSQNPLNFLVNQVWPPENSTENIGSDTPGVDVIFFEGNVGGRSTLSCRDTWLQRKKPYAWWPQDWLPHDVEARVEGNIRVLVLEYSISDSIEGVVEDLKANLIFSGTWNLNRTWQRPIVLVGHSLGCSVIEALVVNLDQNAQQFDLNSVSQHDNDMRRAGTSRAFLDSLAGCFFYAPPCRGVARSPDLLKYVFGGLTYSDELFQKLRVGSTEAFLHFIQTQSRQIRLMALVEGCQTKGRFVVMETAIQDLGIEYLKLEDSNHSEVCKPVDKTHISYEKLLQFIAACAKDAEAF